MIAFFCRTPIQVFRAVQLKMEWFSDTVCDIYVFDSFTSSESIYHSLKNKNIFLNCYHIIDQSYMKEGKCAEIKALFARSSFKKLLEINYYDEIYLFNVYGICNTLIYNVLIKNNGSMIVNLVEDGPALYYFEPYNPNLIKRICYKLLGIKHYIKNIDFWWFSEPDYMDTLFNGVKKKLPYAHKTDITFVNTINEIFGYAPDENVINADILIMEECYWSDGLLKDDSDYKLFKRIKDTFPDKKIVVKLHPRTRENRFKKEFTSIPANGIPWEVYALNMNMERKILVSLSCGTMISTKMLYGEETYSLLLYPLLEERILCRDGSKFLNNERKRRIENERRLYDNKNKYVIAKNFDMAINILNSWLKDIRGY